MEPRFQHDFSRVRVHARPNASASADAIHALSSFGVSSETPAPDLSVSSAPTEGQQAINTSVVEDGEKQEWRKFEAGKTGPTSVEATVVAVKSENEKWYADPTDLKGHYVKQVRLLPGVTEVTGPDGPNANTTPENFCEQVGQLFPARLARGATARWSMLAATIAHENVHAAHMGPALAAAAPAIQGDFNRVTVKDAPGMTAVSALAALQARSDYEDAQYQMRFWWGHESDKVTKKDHADDGPTDQAEYAIFDPMVAKICGHAKANDWRACEYCP